MTCLKSKASDLKLTLNFANIVLSLQTCNPISVIRLEMLVKAATQIAGTKYGTAPCTLVVCVIPLSTHKMVPGLGGSIRVLRSTEKALGSSWTFLECKVDGHWSKDKKVNMKYSAKYWLLFIAIACGQTV